MAEEKKAPVAAKTERKLVKKDKRSLSDRIVKFFRDYKSELKKIVWAPPKQTLRNTIFVLVTVVISGTIVGLLDTAFSKTILALAELL